MSEDPIRNAVVAAAFALVTSKALSPVESKISAKEAVKSTSLSQRLS